MNKSIDVRGKTIDAAVAAALEQLCVDRDEVSVEVLENPKSGFLGIGGSDALVRVSYQVSRTNNLEDFLCGMLVRMGSDAVPNISEDMDGNFSVELGGENLGILIGRRGETLDAIQHLCNYVINRGGSTHVKVSIDAENYRAKRKESLEKLAIKVAGKVSRYRKNVTLEPMNAYERHVIHAALQDFNDISTFSTGTEPNRRIVVSYTKDGQTPKF